VFSTQALSSCLTPDDTIKIVDFDYTRRIAHRIQPPVTPVEIRLLGPDDADVLQHVADGVFDGLVDPRWTREFSADVRHHLIVALLADCVVGMISAVDYVHPDKAPQLWINEVGVAPPHQRRGIGRQLLDAMLEHGRALGCTEAWLGTEEANTAARRLYESTGAAPEAFVLYSFPLTGGSPSA
jgi:ribosomal protein S18 acetylase RimI-like enzyme